MATKEANQPMHVATEMVFQVNKNKKLTQYQDHPHISKYAAGNGNTQALKKNYCRYDFPPASGKHSVDSTPSI